MPITEQTFQEAALAEDSLVDISSAVRGNEIMTCGNLTNERGGFFFTASMKDDLIFKFNQC